MLRYLVLGIAVAGCTDGAPDGAITGYAVGVKVTNGADAQSWYWYEALGGSVIADGVGRSSCAGCHADAPRDHVFTHVR